MLIRPQLTFSSVGLPPKPTLLRRIENWIKFADKKSAHFDSTGITRYGKLTDSERRTLAKAHKLLKSGKVEFGRGEMRTIIKWGMSTPSLRFEIPTLEREFKKTGHYPDPYAMRRILSAKELKMAAKNALAQVRDFGKGVEPKPINRTTCEDAHVEY